MALVPHKVTNLADLRKFFITLEESACMALVGMFLYNLLGADWSTFQISKMPDNN